LGVPLSEPLDRLVDTARLSFFVLAFFTLCGILVAIFGPPEYRTEQVALMIAMLIGHGLPAIGFLILWQVMRRGRSIYFFSVVVLTMLCLAKQTIGTAMLCMGDHSLVNYGLALPLCAPIQFLFLSYIAARCVIAWPEILDLRRAEKRVYAAPAAPLPGMTPPPPTTSIPRPRRSP
jgi:hypothetical protein